MQEYKNISSWLIPLPLEGLGEASMISFQTLFSEYL